MSSAAVIKHVRAAIIVFFVAVHGLYALPTPDRITMEELEEGRYESDIDRWLEVLGTLGLKVDRGWLERQLSAWSTAIDRAHDAARRPFRPLMRVTGTGQGWGLFARTSQRHGRLEIEVMVDGEWQKVYRRHDPELDWMARELHNRRLRAVYDDVTHGRSGVMKSTYRNFTRWIARRRFAEDPEAERVRVQFEYRTASIPPDYVDPKPEIKYRRPHKRENHVE